MAFKTESTIVVLPSSYPMKYRYACAFIEEQTNLIRNRGINVSVIFNESRSISSFSLKKLRHVHFQEHFGIEKSGVPVLRRMSWNIIPTKYQVGKVIWVRDSIRLIESYIKKHGPPDLFHVHFTFNAGIVAKYMKEKWKIPYIITEHSSEYSEAEVMSSAKIDEAYEILNNAEKVIVVSNYLRGAIFQKVGFEKEKMIVIPNFINTDYFNLYNKDDLSVLPINGKFIFTVCGLKYLKRIDRLLDAFNVISQEYPEWKLVIGGDGPEKSNLQTQTAKLGLTDKVIFTGALTKQEVRDYMRQASIFASSSDVETFGIVLIEAMSMGLPVVSTASGGPVDIITRETGVLVEKTVKALTEGLCQVITNYNTYKKEDIRMYALNNFSGNVIADKYIDIYNQLIKK